MTEVPLIVNVCQDCEEKVREVGQHAYMAGKASVLLKAHLANVYWAKHLEELMYPP